MSHGLEYLLDEDGDEFVSFEKIKHRPKTMNDDEMKKSKRIRPQKPRYSDDLSDIR